jgi:hypothetical protein
LGSRGLPRECTPSKNASTSLEIGEIHGHLAIKVSRTKKCLIKNVDTVGSSNGGDSGVATGMFKVQYMPNGEVNDPKPSPEVSPPPKTTQRAPATGCLMDCIGVLPAKILLSASMSEWRQGTAMTTFRESTTRPESKVVGGIDGE